MFIIAGCNCTKPDALPLSGCISATREDDMAKALFIAEKPSVAQEFAKALGRNYEGAATDLSSPTPTS